MMELLISSSLFTAVVTSVITLHYSAINSYGNANQSISMQSGVESDMAMIRELGERYTWCSGSGSVQPSTGGTCSSTTTGNANYYVPTNTGTDSSSGAALDAFTQACNTSTGSSDPLTASLIAAIDAKPSPAGLGRTVKVDSVAAHRLKIEYSSTSLSRVFIYTPPIVGWCP